MYWGKELIIIEEDGTRVIRYAAEALPGVKIESRRKRIPHANGEGFWEHTDYYVVLPDGTEKEYHTKGDAEKAVEKGAKKWRK